MFPRAVRALTPQLRPQAQVHVPTQRFTFAHRTSPPPLLAAAGFVYKRAGKTDTKPSQIGLPSRPREDSGPVYNYDDVRRVVPLTGELEGKPPAPPGSRPPSAPITPSSCPSSPKESSSSPPKDAKSRIRTGYYDPITKSRLKWRKFIWEPPQPQEAKRGPPPPKAKPQVRYIPTEEESRYIHPWVKKLGGMTSIPPHPSGSKFAAPPPLKVGVKDLPAGLRPELSSYEEALQGATSLRRSQKVELNKIHKFRIQRWEKRLAKVQGPKIANSWTFFRRTRWLDLMLKKKNIPLAKLLSHAKDVEARAADIVEMYNASLRKGWLLRLAEREGDNLEAVIEERLQAYNAKRSLEAEARGKGSEDSSATPDEFAAYSMEDRVTAAEQALPVGKAVSDEGPDQSGKPPGKSPAELEESEVGQHSSMAPIPEALSWQPAPMEADENSSKESNLEMDAAQTPQSDSVRKEQPTGNSIAVAGEAVEVRNTFAEQSDIDEESAPLEAPVLAAKISAPAAAR